MIKEVHLASPTFVKPTLCGHGGKSPMVTADMDDVTCEHCNKLTETNGREWCAQYEAYPDWINAQ